VDQGHYIVADLGKTHAKLTLWSRSGLCIAREVRANAVPASAPYRPLDVAGIGAWLIATLAKYATHPVEAIIPVSHGAAVAGIRGSDLAFTPPDYEWEIPAPFLADYRAQRDPFPITGSPAFPAGLNFGAQLHYLESLGHLEGVTLLPYAQYWAWLLSGVAVSEVTSLGCHSDLWEPAARDYSPMAKARGWAQQFAPLAKAGDVIGALRSELAAQTGLLPTVRIHAGLHDSNAALVAARGFPEIDGREATVLSTGTWFVAMRSPSEPLDLALDGARDCLINMDVNGDPVPSARFMGGREIEVLGERIDRPGIDGVAEVLALGAMVLPSQVPGSGPFPTAQGRWINAPENAEIRSAAVALYAALMADVSLGLIGARETLLIEGRFAASETFTRALATLRPDITVYTAKAEADVSFGALRMINPDLKPQGSLTKIQPLPLDLSDYKQQWINHIEGNAA
jgi:sugar (pentulose or hexulose) kinase